MEVDDNSNGGKSDEKEGVRMSHEENSVGNCNPNYNTILELSGASLPSTMENSSGPDGFIGKGDGDDTADDSNVHINSASVKKRATKILSVGPGEVGLRFIFANHDGVNVRIVAPLSSSISSIKMSLLSSWPEGVENAETPSQLRFMSMGHTLFEDMTLASSRLKVYDNYVPIHVSLKPRACDLLQDNPARKKGQNSSGSWNCCTIC